MFRFRRVRAALRSYVSFPQVSGCGNKRFGIVAKTTEAHVAAATQEPTNAFRYVVVVNMPIPPQFITTNRTATTLRLEENVEGFAAEPIESDKTPLASLLPVLFTIGRASRPVFRNRASGTFLGGAPRTLLRRFGMKSFPFLRTLGLFRALLRCRWMSGAPGSRASRILGTLLGRHGRAIALLSFGGSFRDTGQVRHERKLLRVHAAASFALFVCVPSPGAAGRDLGPPPTATVSATAGSATGTPSGFSPGPGAGHLSFFLANPSPTGTPIAPPFVYASSVVPASAASSKSTPNIGVRSTFSRP